MGFSPVRQSKLNVLLVQCYLLLSNIPYTHSNLMCALLMTMKLSSNAWPISMTRLVVFMIFLVLFKLLNLYRSESTRKSRIYSHWSWRHYCCTRLFVSSDERDAWVNVTVIISNVYRTCTYVTSRFTKLIPYLHNSNRPVQSSHSEKLL
jgi:hypothetical protein